MRVQSQGTGARHTVALEVGGQRLRLTAHGNEKHLEGLAALVPLLDTNQLDAEALATLNTLRRWDHVADHAREEEALFQMWFDSTRTALWAPLQEHPLPLGDPTPYNTIRILADSALRNTVEQALDVDARAVVLQAFRSVVDTRRSEGP